MTPLNRVSVRLAATAVALSANLVVYAADSQQEKTQKQKVGGKAALLADHFGKSSNPHIRPYAYLLSGSVWPSRKVFVCWDNPSPQFSGEMEIVRTAVADSWEKFSALTFVGWKKCATVNEGIRITISDEGPYTRGLGKNLQVGKGTAAGGMVLNFTFKNWSSSCQAQDRKSMCIRSIAMHEFGHAIGFAHEQNRPDKPGECLQPAQGTNGDILLTPYDPESIMNYCFNTYTKNVGLSKLDISAVRQVYGSEDDKLALK
jgi:hypothetical protein